MAKFRRKITPMGRKTLDIAATDYHLGEAIEAWANEIVNGAGRKKRPLTEVGLHDVLHELEDLASATKSDWDHTVQRFREAGWLERVAAVCATITQRGLPYKYRVNTRIFYGLSDHSVPVQVRVVYEIDSAKNVVVFHTFGCYTPSPRNIPEGTGRAENW